MTKNDTQLKLAQESVNMLNMIAERDKYGESWKWVSGMLTHHLDVAAVRLKHLGDESKLDPPLNDDVFKLILKYLEQFDSYGMDQSGLIYDLTNAGLVDRILDSEQGG